jgi:radical SAM/Cys-rich protein
MNSFDAALNTSHLFPLKAREVTTLQVNLGKFCNQVCKHCHVDAGPHRIAEQMTHETAEKVIDVLRKNSTLKTLDITGGAPELNPHFRDLVCEARSLGCHVLDRCNLTVLYVKGQEDLADFLVKHRVKIIASLPCYLKENVDQQRGLTVFEQSISALQWLNDRGYGMETSPQSGLELDFVYNPLGPSLPPNQAALERDYKRELFTRYGIKFNRLYTLTNMPIARFKQDLQQSGRLEKYRQLLEKNFNAQTLPNLMCHSQISVSWDGRMYDCDFNQMLELPLQLASPSIENFDMPLLTARTIRTGEHCFGCTAGAGSSCSGSLR